MNEEQMRVRTIFAKTEAMRYTGHLDLFREGHGRWRGMRLGGDHVHRA